MLIGGLAKMAGVSIDTIRYYEREGLIKPTSIRDSGYREFDDRVADRLGFITRAKKLGFSLQEIRDLFSLKDNPNATYKDVKVLAEMKLDNIMCKINMLQDMRQEIEVLVTACKGDDSGLEGCPIMDGLGGKKKH